MNITRRGFLKFIASLPVALAVPAFSKTRSPYVVTGEGVDYIGSRRTGQPTFIGSCLVDSIGEFDGVGYPVVLMNQSYGPARAPEGTFYDFDLSNFNRDVPKHFWHDPENVRRYPNVHTYVREQRFGESVVQAIEKLNFATIDKNKYA